MHAMGRHPTITVFVVLMASLSACSGTVVSSPHGSGGTRSIAGGTSSGGSGGTSGATGGSFTAGGSGSLHMAGLAMGCVLNSDCAQPFTCDFGVCHLQCGGTRDCPNGQRCVRTTDASVCQLPSETRCAFNSDCPAPLVCSVDTQCRNQCQTDRDCISGQVCVLGGMCADTSELDATGNMVGPLRDGG
jgi:hypothetical protein